MLEVQQRSLMQNLVLICSPVMFTDMNLINSCCNAENIGLLKVLFSFYPTVGLFSMYEMKCFSCN